jgi:hypothetical protein
MTIQQTKPGPKPIKYIPQPYRHVPGVERITTPRQLARLRDYLNTSPKQRAPFVRLGASVPPPHDLTRNSTATYAVTVDGEVSVICLERDPRAAERWVSNPRRPWNMDKAFATRRAC